MRARLPALPDVIPIKHHQIVIAGLTRNPTLYVVQPIVSCVFASLSYEDVRAMPQKKTSQNDFRRVSSKKVSFFLISGVPSFFYLYNGKTS